MRNIKLLTILHFQNCGFQGRADGCKWKKKENRINILKQTILHATLKIVLNIVNLQKQTAFFKQMTEKFGKLRSTLENRSNENVH